MTLYSSFLLLPDLEACGYETTKEYNSFYFNFCDFLPQVVLGEHCQFSVKKCWHQQICVGRWSLTTMCKFSEITFPKFHISDIILADSKKRWVLGYGIFTIPCPYRNMTKKAYVDKTYKQCFQDIFEQNL